MIRIGFNVTIGTIGLPFFVCAHNTDDVILDVRSEAEWNSGHIEGATLAISLGSFGNMGHMGAAPSDLAGCEQCTIAVYCRKLLLCSRFCIGS